MWTDVPLRRADRALSPEASQALLQAGRYGVLASADDAGLPLATPISYVLLEGALYFHCAATGHKLKNISARPEVCFCVVGCDEPLFNGNFTTLYESVMIFGAAALVEDPAEKDRVLTALCEKYLPAHMAEAPENIQRNLPHTTVVRVDIRQISGKANRPAGA